MSDLSSGIVSTDWLAARLADNDIAVADVSWYLPDMKRNPQAEYRTSHIPGAVFVDLDRISAPSSPLPHMLSTPAYFAEQMAQLGFSKRDKIVCYDGAGIFSAARFWWMCRAMGHEDVAILNGGFPKWLKEGLPVTDEVSARTSAGFDAALRPEMLVEANEIRDALSRDLPQIADARGPARFSAQEPEPRAGVRGGHIPSSVNVHYKSLLTDNEELKTPSEIAKVFKHAGLDPSKPIIATCGSGVTAAILRLALHQLDAPEGGLYDGSWAEWGARHDLPIAT